MRFGKIPSKILFVGGVPSTFQCNWDDVDTSIAEGRQVVANFAADAESADNVAQALRWGRDQLRSARLPDGEPRTEERRNEPFPITVIGLEKRMEGGRAFKVIDCVNRMFDLREDVLLEALQSVGVTPGGRIQGEFIFAKIGSQMRLVRVGSSLHAEMLKSEERRQAKNVSPNDLVAGGLYANRRGLVIYLGRVDTVEDIFVGSPQNGVPVTAAATAELKKLAAASKGTIKRVEVVGEHLSIPIAKHNQNDPENCFANALRNACQNWCFQFGKSISAVELVRRLDIGDDLIERVRKHATQQLLSRNDNRRKDVMAAASAKLNMRPHGEGARAFDEYEALLRTSQE